MAGKKGVKRTRSAGLRARAWWVLRKNKRLTLAELLLSINDGSSKCPERNLGTFLAKLTQVGILHRERLPDGKLTSNGVYLYTLRTDLGAKSPVIRKTGVYDPNSKNFLELGHGNH